MKRVFEPRYGESSGRGGDAPEQPAPVMPKGVGVRLAGGGTGPGFAGWGARLNNVEYMAGGCVCSNRQASSLIIVRDF